METINDRYIRQREIVDINQLSKYRYYIVGTGSIGRQVAIQLASLGVPNMVLYDPDVVNIENLATQGFIAEDIGKYKVNVVADLCRVLNSDCNIDPRNSLFDKRRLPLNAVIFSCVDNIKSRRIIYDASKNSALLIDGRMLGEVLRILVTNFKDKYYEKTLFSESEAVPGRCTARGTIYTSNICAGLMISRLVAWLREDPIIFDILFNIRTADICLNCEEENEH